MFKPSLKRSVLKEKLLINPHEDTLRSSPLNQQLSSHISNRPSLPAFQPNQSSIQFPSMLLPQELLQKRSFSHNKNYSHVFTPLSYNFKPYLKEVQKMIKENPKMTHFGRVAGSQINFAFLESTLVLWIEADSSRRKQIWRLHNFPYQIGLVEGGPINSQFAFNESPFFMLAVTLKNKISFYRIQLGTLKLHDLMSRYVLKSCKNIHKVKFTKHNQVILSGDSGKVAMVSFNSEKDLTIQVISPFFKKYCSEQSFDYFTEHRIRDIILGQQQFMYILHDKISRQNWVMHKLRCLFNKIIKLNKEPVLLTFQTSVDVYKLRQERMQLVFIDRLKEQQIKNQIMGHRFYQGQGLIDGLCIASIQPKSSIQASKQNTDERCRYQDQQNINNKSNLSSQSQDKLSTSNLRIASIKKHCNNIQQQYQMSSSQTEEESDPYLQFDTSAILTVRTKCGYSVDLRHRSQPLSQLYKSGKKQVLHQKDSPPNFIFQAKPTKIPEYVGQSPSLFLAKNYPSILTRKQFRRSHLITSVGENSSSVSRNIHLMSDKLVYINEDRSGAGGNKSISMLKIKGLKRSYQVYQSSEQQKQCYFPTIQQYEAEFGYNPFVALGREEQHIMGINNNNTKNMSLVNFQRKWIIFSDQGTSHVYLMELRHIILTYLYYKCEYKHNRQATAHEPADKGHHEQKKKSRNNYSHQQYYIEFDPDFQIIIEKFVKVYGLCAFSKALLEILLNNHGTNRQFFYIQPAFLQIIRKQYDCDSESVLPIAFQEWNYALNTEKAEQQDGNGKSSSTIKIVPSPQILKQVWVLLLENQFRQTLSTQRVSNQLIYNKEIKEMEEFAMFFQNQSQSYCCFGFALQSMFYEIIHSTLMFKAKDYKLKYRLLKQTQNRLSDLRSVVEEKRVKENSLQFKHYLKDKLNKINIYRNNGVKGKQQGTSMSTNNSSFSASQEFANNSHHRQYLKKFNITGIDGTLLKNTSDSTTVANANYKVNVNDVDDETFMDDGDDTLKAEGFNEFSQSQSNISVRNPYGASTPASTPTMKSVSYLENLVINSTQKMVTLISVMSVLVEKDEREGLPSFYETLTDLSNQRIIGREFFKQDLFVESGKGDGSDLSSSPIVFIHPNLVREASAYIPQLQIERRIQYVKFKKLRNINLNPNPVFSPNSNQLLQPSSQLPQQQLASLNLNQLIQLIDSSQLQEVRGFILGNGNYSFSKTEFAEKRFYCYLQFLIRWMVKSNSKLTQLRQLSKKSNFQQVSLEFNILEKQALSAQHQKRYSVYPSQQQRLIPTLNSTSSSNNFTCLTFDINPHSIVLTKQLIAIEQSQILILLKQFQRFFTEILEIMLQFSGPVYLAVEQFLEYMIRISCEYFSNDLFLMQFIREQLKRVRFLEKVVYMTKFLQGQIDNQGNQRKVIKVEKANNFMSASQHSTLSELNKTQSTNNTSARLPLNEKLRIKSGAAGRQQLPSNTSKTIYPS